MIAAAAAQVAGALVVVQDAGRAVWLAWVLLC